jgi:hypothetical protein
MEEEKDYWVNHPEIKNGEIFITNVDEKYFPLLTKWRSMRLGNIAYERCGKKFGEYPKIFPIFVQVEELEKNSQGREVLAKLRAGTYY